MWAGAKWWTSSIILSPGWFHAKNIYKLNLPCCAATCEPLLNHNATITLKHEVLHMQITHHNWKNHHLNESRLVLTTITSTMLVRTSGIRGTPCKSGWRSPPRAVPINIPTCVQTPHDTWILLCTWHLYTCIYSSVQFLCTNFNHGTAHALQLA